MAVDEKTTDSLSLQQPDCPVSCKIPSPSSKEKRSTPETFIFSVASNITSQPLQNSDPNVWGVLTAISTNARKRRQGLNMLLTADEHYIGRMVQDRRFQIEANSVSGKHCGIFRKRVGKGDADHQSNGYVSVYLKDTSTNGTFLNWEKLTKDGPEVELRHGDIVSFVSPPHLENAFAFVYREVAASIRSAGSSVKRKADDSGSESKRLRGIGIGSADGPISLDDFRSLQRSNTELREVLENHVRTIDTLRSENHATTERHENEKKELKESVEKSFTNQIKELQLLLEVKQTEVDASNKMSSEQKHTIVDLNERLSASIQSCAEAKEIMDSQKLSISDLKAQIEEERDQKRGEQEKAAADLKLAVQKAQSDAEEELKRTSEAASRRERELKDVINKLQESEKERCSLVETLRTKLEDTRRKLVISDNKVRQLETRVCEEQSASANARKRLEELEDEMKRTRKELESEKSAREDAWAKVSELELEINSAMRDLEYERRRLKAARERIMLRETQLRAFYSTTEEISVLFGKQQEQLKAMQRTLEDEENYENASTEFDLNVAQMNVNETPVNENHLMGRTSKSMVQRSCRNDFEISCDEASDTEKHDCEIRTQEGQNTQEVDSVNGDQFFKGGFGSDINGGTEPNLEGGDPLGTERVLETESPELVGEQNIDLNRWDGAGETMQLDEVTQVKVKDHDLATAGQLERNSQTSNPTANVKSMEDTEPSMIRTQDLLTSEVAGSWACSTAPSAHGENESPRSRDDDDEGIAPLHDSNTIVAESQSAPSGDVISGFGSHECRALSEMIGIVAPDLKDEFSGAIAYNHDQGREEIGSASNSDSEEGRDDNDHDGNNFKVGSISDAETEGSQDHTPDDMDEDDEATQEDSLG